jgi:hypothetical protein
MRWTRVGFDGYLRRYDGRRTGMTDLRLDCQLPDEVRTRLSALAAEFIAAQDCYSRVMGWLEVEMARNRGSLSTPLTGPSCAGCSLE